MEALLSTPDRAFIVGSLYEGSRRADGRRAMDMRVMKVSYLRSDATSLAEVQLGETRVRAVVTSEITPPYPDRPAEGQLSFNVEWRPVAGKDGGAQLIGGRQMPRAVELGNFVQRAVRDSRAVDTEALCIIAGEKSWTLRCDLHVDDDGGNVTDAAMLATMAALRHFRLPCVTVNGPSVVQHPADERTPNPLSIHHTPVAVTFAVFGRAAGATKDGQVAAAGGKDGSEADDGVRVVILDPSRREEMAMDGSLTVLLNKHKEICGVQKLGGGPMDLTQIHRYARLAANKAAEISDFLSASLASEEQRLLAALRTQIRTARSAADAYSSADMATSDGVAGLEHGSTVPRDAAPQGPRGNGAGQGVTMHGGARGQSKTLTFGDIGKADDANKNEEEEEEEEEEELEEEQAAAKPLSFTREEEEQEEEEEEEEEEEQGDAEPMDVVPSAHDTNAQKVKKAAASKVKAVGSLADAVKPEWRKGAKKKKKKKKGSKKGSP